MVSVVFVKGDPHANHRFGPFGKPCALVVGENETFDVADHLTQPHMSLRAFVWPDGLAN